MLFGKKICYYMLLLVEMFMLIKFGRDFDQIKVRICFFLNKFMYWCNFKFVIFGLFDYNFFFSFFKGMVFIVFIYYDGMLIIDWFFIVGYFL